MKTKKSVALLLVLVLCASMLAGCSTISSNSSTYFSQMSRNLSIWFGGSSDSSSSSDDGKASLSAPENWSVTDTGDYSFDAVENASYYIIYLYDKQSEDTSFAYMSTNIEDDGSTSYSGALTDLFAYCYGLYDAEVVAYPEIGNTEYKKSAAAECDFSVTGQVDDPEIGYLWDCFSGSLGVELLNFESYSGSSMPTKVEVTFTNQADSADVVTLSFENVSIEDDVFYASTEDVTVDATYAISATVTWDSEIVTNSTITVDLGTLETASDKNAMTDGYGYLDTNVYLSLDYPMVVTDFDPEAGGSAGTWYFFVNAFTTNKGVAIPSTFIDCLNYQGEKGAMGADYHDGEDVEFTVFPVEANEGSAYSYTLTVQGPREVISLFDGFFWNDMPAGEGTLELYEDGTFTMAIIVPESDDSSGGWGVRSISASSISGLWVENGDGTVTLSYDHSTSALT